MAYRRPEVNWKNQLNENELKQYEGFVYRITEKSTGKSYIGKKSYWSRTSKAVPGRKNRQRFVNESDWKKYTSSNDELKKLVKEKGPDEFEFEILKHCADKRRLTYYELYYQIKEDVFHAKLDNGEYKYYNDNLLGKFYRKHLD